MESGFLARQGSKVSNKRVPPQISFWRHVNRIADDTSCWEWTACKNSRGYGRYRLNRVMTQAHRAAWILTNGKLENNDLVCHGCNNPGCVRPDHLYKGDAFTNMRDRKIDGKYYGRHNGNCRLNWKTVQAIRSRSNVSSSVLGKEFGIHRSHVWRIRNNEDWKVERLPTENVVNLNG
jgi:hypothetical protein